MRHEIIGEIWRFETKNFRVVMVAEPEDDMDLSWDEDGDARDGLESGRYVGFVAHSKVTYKPTGDTLGEDYLGGCIYESLESFRDHIGLAAKARADGHNYGSYFVDMIRSAIDEARKHAEKMRAVPLHA